jgi:uncharacterized protein YecE (DUF72 family)
LDWAFLPGRNEDKRFFRFLFETFSYRRDKQHILPKKQTFEGWREGSPGNFIFSVKASRYITHMKKLKEPKDALDKFLSSVDLLGKKLGPILFQLPPRWKVNVDRLRFFLNSLPKGYKYTFEFRDESWFDDRVYAVLCEKGAAFCTYELEGNLSPKAVTADFVYIRLHGPGAAYEGQYNAQTLAGWAGAISAWRNEQKDVYCYFDNDQAGFAAQDAMKLQDMLK